MPGPTFGGTAVVSLPAGSSATTAVAAVLDNTYCRTTHTLVVTTGTGVSAGTVALQLSQDGTNWFQFATTISTTAASTVYQATATGAWQFVRAAITGTITNGTVTATVASSG